MKRKNHTGLHLERAQAASGGWSGLFAGWLTLLGVSALLHACVGSAGNGWLALPAAGSCAFLLWGVLLWRKKPRWGMAAVLALALAAALAFLPAMTGGAKLVASFAAQRWTAVLGRLVLATEVPELTAWQQAVFYSVCGLVLAAICRVIGAAARSAAVLLTLGAAVLAVAMPEERLWLFPALGAAVLLVLLAGGSGRAALARVLTGASALAVLAAVCLLAAPIRDGSWLAQLHDAAAESLHTLRYEQGISALPEGDFSEPVAEPTGEQTVLRVTAELAETLYLRGFVGDRFDGSCWKPISNADAAEHSTLLYWLHREGFWPQSQLSQTMGQLETNRVSVENIGACSAYIYAPCNLRSLSGLEPERLLPSALEAGGLSGQRQYTYTTVYDPAETIAQTVEQLKEDGDEAYLSREGSYRTMVLEQALQLPEGGMTAMASALDACAALYGGRESLSMEQAEACVLIFLQKYLAEGELSLPLDDTARGTVFQTATATVLALRYLGIPARYVEGYLVSAEQLEGGAAAVAASAGTAWAEVYQDGIGWIPLELTPGMQAISGQVAESLQSLHGGGLQEGNGDVVLPEGKELEPEEDEVEDTPSDAPDQRTPQVTLFTRPIFWVLLAVAVICLLLAAMWLRHFVIVRRRRALFDQPDHRQALCCLFGDGAQLLEQMGLRRNGGSMLALCTGEQISDEALRQQLEQAIWLNHAAMFSSHPISEQQRQQMAEFRALTLEKLKQQTRRGKRLLLRWVKCVY